MEVESTSIGDTKYYYNSSKKTRSLLSRRNSERKQSKTKSVEKTKTEPQNKRQVKEKTKKQTKIEEEQVVVVRYNPFEQTKF